MAKETSELPEKAMAAFAPSRIKTAQMATIIRFLVIGFMGSPSFSILYDQHTAFFAGSPAGGVS